MPLEVRGCCPYIQVFDMPAALRFYRDLLGFEVVHAAPDGDDCDWALLRLQGTELMLNTQYEAHARPAAPDPSRTAAHRDTMLFFACPDVEAAYEHLRTRGVAVQPPVVRDYGMKQLHVTDPDGYGLCFQWAVA